MKISIRSKSVLGLAAAMLLGACAPVERVRRQHAMSASKTEKVESKYTGPRRRIGVVDFENKSGYGQGRLGTAAADILITELTKTGKFVVVERDKLNKIFEEQRLQASGAISAHTAVKVGKILGLNAIVTGVISAAGVKTEGSDYLLIQTKRQTAEVTVDIRLVDTETGQVLYADSGKGTAKVGKGSFLGMGTKGGYDETLESKALRAGIVQFIDNIVSQVNKRPWSCRIASVMAGNKVVLNAGVNMGVERGLELECFHLGKKIMDPTTGLLLGYEEQSLGTAKVISQLGDSGEASIALIKSGGLRPKVKDICRLPE